MNNTQEVLERFELDNAIELIEFQKILKEEYGEIANDVQISDFNELSNDFSMIACFDKDDAAQAASNVLEYDRL
jgi:hypothetical protein